MISNFPIRFSDVVQYDLDKNYTREQVTLKAETAYKMGDIVAKETSGKIVPINPAAEDSTATFYGVFLSEDITTGEDDTSVYATLMVNGPAILLENCLDFHTTDTSKKNTIIAAMDAAGIKVQTAKV